MAARFASRPAGGLLAAAFLRGGDTDTLASMAAAILGSLHGTGWTYGLADAVQDSDYLVEVAQRTAERRTADVSVPVTPPLQARKRLISVLASGKTSEIQAFPDGRKVTVESFEPLPVPHMQRAKLRLGDGQVVFIDVAVDAISSTSGPKNDQRTESESAPRRSATNAAKVPESKPVREQFGAIAGLVLPTANLRRSAAFYAQLLGEEVSIRDRQLTIAPWLILRESDRGGKESVGEIALTVPTSTR